MDAVAQALDSAGALLADGRPQPALDILDAARSTDEGERVDGREAELLRAQVLAELGRRDEASAEVTRVWYGWWMSSVAGGRPTGHPCTDEDVAYNLDRAVALQRLLPYDFMPAFLASRFAMELGKAERALGDLNTTGALLDEQLRRDPGSVRDQYLTEYWRVRIACLLDLGDWQGIIEVTDRWLELEVDNPNVLARRALVLPMLNERRDAAETWAKVLALEPDDMMALEHLHLFESETNGILSPTALATLNSAYRVIRDGAELDYEDRAKWAKTAFETTYALATAARTAEASGWLECAIWLGANDEDAIGCQAECLMAMNDYPRARQAVTTLLAVNPGDFYALGLRKRIETEIEGEIGPGVLATLAEAYRLITKGAVLDQEQRVVWANMMFNAGLALGHAERYPEAVSWLECAIWVNPNDPDYHTLLEAMRALAASPHDDA